MSIAFHIATQRKNLDINIFSITESESRLSVVMCRKAHVWFLSRLTSYLWHIRKLLEPEDISHQNVNQLLQYQLHPPATNLFLCTTSSCLRFLNKESFLLGHCNVFSNKCHGQIPSKMYWICQWSWTLGSA